MIFVPTNAQKYKIDKFIYVRYSTFGPKIAISMDVVNKGKVSS